MADNSHAEIERLTDLLVEKSTLGLTVSQEAELRELQKDHGPIAENTFDLAVAAFDLAFGQRRVSSMPTHVRARILSQTTQHLSAADSRPSRTQSGE